MTYTANKNNGVGQITNKTETHYTVYFEETDLTKNLIKRFVKVYESIEEAEKEVENIRVVNDMADPKMPDTSLTINGIVFEDMAEYNLYSAKRNLPSSMR